MRLIRWIKKCIKMCVKAVLPPNVYAKAGMLYRQAHAKADMFCYKVHAAAQMRRKGADAEGINPHFGVNLFCYCTDNSAGIEAVLLGEALKAGQIPYQIIDLNVPEKIRTQLKEKQLYHVNLVVCHAASGTPARLRTLGIDLKRYYNIGYWAWELSTLPDEFCEGLDVFQEMWTMSSFCTDTLEKRIGIPVLTIPLYANQNRTVLENDRAYFNLAKDAFLFMIAYDCTSFVSRKNPQAAATAFMKAFTPADENVGLVLKLSYAEKDRRHIEELMEHLAPYKNIYCIEKRLSDVEMRTLIHAVDAFVTLHRSEGFGLMPLEAMSLGTPVISTEWSGNMEYMNHMNAALVGYDMIPVNGEYVGSAQGDDSVWADPHVDEAAAYMRRMVADAEWRKALVDHGKHTADERYCVKRIGEMMRDRLSVLRLI